MMKNTDRIFVDHIEVAGLQTAIRGMRNPMDSWSKSDSYVDDKGNFIIGMNDKDLAQRLISAGSEHCKFLRQIYVGFDIVLPRYIWSEFDTYHYNTKNSCSTMHKLFRKDKLINLYQFVYHEDDEEVMEDIIKQLNTLRALYFNSATKDKNEILRRAKQILPEGFLQRRTVSTNYAELRNIYHQRCYHKHRLPCWAIIGEFIKSLPYAKELILHGMQ